ncbi:hypothetical protein LCGC14_2115800, partial [marine sediment metagenome]
MIEVCDDAERIRPLLDEWYEEQEGAVFGMDMNVDAYIKDMNRWLGNLGGIILIAFEESVLVGFMTLIIVPSEFGNQTWCIEKGWYVRPRSKSSGIRLYRKAENWCREKGCSHLIMTASRGASSLHDKLCRFYERMEMKQLETSYA